MNKLFAAGWLIVAVIAVPRFPVRGEPDSSAWPRFRGPNGQGQSDVKTIPVAIRNEDIRWRAKLPGTGHSSPVIRNGRVVVTCATREPGRERRILCYDADSGRNLWERKYDFEPYEQHLHNNYAASTPYADEDRIFVQWTRGPVIEVFALDYDGKEIWRRELKPFAAAHGSGVSPVVAGGVLMVCNDQEGPDSFLTGLDKKTGETLWTRPRVSDKASYSTPMILNGESGSQGMVFLSQAHGLTSLDPKTGALIWETPPLFELRTVASPVLADGVIYAQCGTGGSGRDSVAVRPGGPGRKPEEVYRIKKSLPYAVTPVAHGPYLFLWTDQGGIVTCIKAASGEPVWQERVGGNFYASPLCIDGKIYGLSRDGEMIVIEAGPVFKELARYQFGEGTHATPAVYDGKLYVRTFSELICIGGM